MFAFTRSLYVNFISFSLLHLSFQISSLKIFCILSVIIVANFLASVLVLTIFWRLFIFSSVKVPISQFIIVRFPLAASSHSDVVLSNKSLITATCMSLSHFFLILLAMYCDNSCVISFHFLAKNLHAVRWLMVSFCSEHNLHLSSGYNLENMLCWLAHVGRRRL